MNVTVRLFAGLVETVGRRSIALTLPDDASVSDCMRMFTRDVPPHLDLATLKVAAAVNREYREGDHRLRDGDEIAFIPPVSGGSGEARVHGRVTPEPLSMDRVLSRVRDPRAGAIVTFCGVTRDVPVLEYEAYAEMAESLLIHILDQIAQAHEVIAIAAEHRVGTVPREEPSVIIAVSSAHRVEAFAASRSAIDRIKERLPIWKTEIDDDGRPSRVAGTPITVSDE